MPYAGGPMSEAMFYVLLALMNPAHGYRLMQDIEKVSHGRLKIGPGTLYGVLTRMQKDELISLDIDDGRRKVYRITPEGKKALDVEFERLRAMVYDAESMQGGGFNE